MTYNKKRQWAMIDPDGKVLNTFYRQYTASQWVRKYERDFKIKCSIRKIDKLNNNGGNEDNGKDKRKDWKENIVKAVDVFSKKHGFLPAWQNAVPDTSEKNVKILMKTIFNKFSKKNN
jgi:hypothetical protein